MKTWLTQHANALRDALRRLGAAPLNTALALFVIGIALTLPAAGWLLIDNVHRTVHSSATTQQISLFMAADAKREAIAEIKRRLQATVPDHWQFVTRDEALTRLQESAGMAEIVASLPRNPLPDAFIVEPADKRPAAMDELAKTFADWPQVAHVQLDSAWIRRLDALLRLGQLAVTLLGVVFAAALVAVTFNTIRLQILAQGAEIEVARLIGATDAWIRRPFTYFGALQGAFGGLLATVLLAVASGLLKPAIDELAQLYATDFTLHGPGVGVALALVAIGGALGWIGAQISVMLSLRQA